MPKKVFSSWRSNADGKFGESDYKFCIYDEESTYEIETAKPTMGIALGPDLNGNSYTVILRLIDMDGSLEKIKSIIHIGDVLVAVNDRAVLDESYVDVTSIIDLLTMSGFPRRLKFLDLKKCSLESYRLRLEASSKLRTDLLGFNCSAGDLLSEQAYRSATQTVTARRDLEWVDYLKSIGGADNIKPAGIYKPSKDLKTIVRRGIPVAFRALIWPKISLSSIHRLDYPKDYYQQLLGRVSEIHEKTRDDIEKDVDRTFPEHIYFENAGKGEHALRRILQAFAVHNPDIGYCQSLNFVAGMMLILLEEEEAFWLLVTVVEQLLPPDYYTKSMVGTYVDQFVLAHIIKKHLPKIHTALEQNQLQLPLITVQWFMCLFVNTLRPEVTLRVWDMFLNEGSKVLFRISAALFKLHEKRLIGVKDASDLFTVLRSIGKDCIDPDILIAAAYKDFSTRPLSFSRSLGMSGGGGRNSSGRNILNSAGVSPRLSSRAKLLGAVPADLIGVGFAHTGPADALEKYRAKIAANDSPSRNGRLQEVARSLSDDGVKETAQRISDQLMAEDTTSADESGVTSGDENETGKAGVTSPSTTAMTSSLPSSDVVVDAKDIRNEDAAMKMEILTAHAPSSSPQKSIRKVEVDASNTAEKEDEAFSNPSILLSRISEVNMSGAFQQKHAEQKGGGAKAKQHVKKSDRTERKVRNGDLSFYRADIAVWRNSFRPGLEERYEKMEAARSVWRRDTAALEFAAKAAAAGEAVTADEQISEQINELSIVDVTIIEEDTSSSPPNLHSNSRGSLSSSPVNKPNSSSSHNIRNSFSNSFSNNSPAGMKRLSKVDLSLPIAKDVLDSNYSIDHEFVDGRAEAGSNNHRAEEDEV